MRRNERIWSELVGLVTVLIMFGFLRLAAADDTQESSQVERSDVVPLSPQDALASIQVRDGFTVELVASEPLLMDPVAIDWDAQGRLWVVEMADYPMGMDGNGKPGGRVRILEDSTGDGHYDKSTLFLDGLSFPNGIITWRDGVLITAAPDIIYAVDTDGDGRADKQQVLFTGFNPGNQQLRMNGLRWGLDNWVYCASGSHHAGYGADTGVTAVAMGERVTIGSRDFRIRPDEHLIDPQSGPSQFGRNRDDWGNWFGVQNSYPLWHYVLADHYIRRNAFYAPPNPRHDLTEANPTLYPVKKPQKRFHSFEHATRFTSACSGNVYRDTLLFSGSLFSGPSVLSPSGSSPSVLSSGSAPGRTALDHGTPAGSAIQHCFTCAPFHSLVQHNLLREAGTTFELRRDPSEIEYDYFASTDRWCRPVMVRTGPDGGLWIVDMYRYMIEHPEWIDEAARNELRPYYRHGESQGRIYRVRPNSAKLHAIPRLADLTPPQLVAKLSDQNGWVRDKSQQLLIWRGDKSCLEPLRKLVRDSDIPLVRLHAICTLDGLSSIDEATLLAAIHDPHPGVSREAIRIAERHSSPGIVKSLVALVADNLAGLDAKVRLQLACSLGEFDDPMVGAAVAKLLIDPGSDPYIRGAAMSSITDGNIDTVISLVLSSNELNQQVFASLVRMAAKSNDGNSLEKIFPVILASTAMSERWWFDVLATLLDEVPDELAQWQTSRPATEPMQRTMALAQSIAEDNDMNVSVRVAAIQLVAREPLLNEASLAASRRLTAPQQPPEIHAAIVSRLSHRSESTVAVELLKSWQSYGPALRAQVLNVLLSREVWTAALLDAVESQSVRIADLDMAMRQRLVTSRSDALKQRAESLFATSMSTDRQAVMESFRPALDLPTNVEAGQEIFAAKCASCHQIAEVGKPIGPNLVALTDKSPLSLLTAILNPNFAVEAKYLSYAVADTDGRTHSGLIKTETATSITLVTSDAQELTILRSEVEDLSSTGKSLMPDGLESDLTLQDLANLVGYLGLQK